MLKQQKIQTKYGMNILIEIEFILSNCTPSNTSVFFIHQYQPNVDAEADKLSSKEQYKLVYEVRVVNAGYAKRMKYIGAGHVQNVIKVFVQCVLIW